MHAFRRDDRNGSVVTVNGAQYKAARVERRRQVRLWQVAAWAEKGCVRKLHRVHSSKISHNSH